MAEIKVSLTVTLQGRVMMSEQECSKNPKQNYNEFDVKVATSRKGKSPKIDTYHVRTRKTKSASQHLNINLDAYETMTAKDNKKAADAMNCPYWSSPAKWFPLSKKQRLEAHLQRICEGLGGTSYTYEVFED